MANPSIEPGQLCLGCGANPATSADGTVPLCSSCAAQAKEAKRGVKYEKKSSVFQYISNQLPHDPAVLEQMARTSVIYAPFVPLQVSKIKLTESLSLSYQVGIRALAPASRESFF